MFVYVSRPGVRGAVAGAPRRGAERVCLDACEGTTATYCTTVRLGL